MKSLDELDRLCATEVMGWHLGAYGDWFLTADEDAKTSGYTDPSTTDGRKEYEWQPSRNISQAWQCLEKLELPFNISGTGFGRNHFFCQVITQERRIVLTDDSLPLLIVKCCLSAKGVPLE